MVHLVLVYHFMCYVLFTHKLINKHPHHVWVNLCEHVLDEAQHVWGVKEE